MVLCDYVGARATPVATSSTSGLVVPALTPIQLAPVATEATPPVVVSGQCSIDLRVCFSTSEEMAALCS